MRVAVLAVVEPIVKVARNTHTAGPASLSEVGPVKVVVVATRKALLLSAYSLERCLAQFAKELAQLEPRWRDTLQ